MAFYQAMVKFKLAAIVSLQQHITYQDSWIRERKHAFRTCV